MEEIEEKPLFEFYRCFDCKKVTEEKKMIRDVYCSCGGRRYRPTHLNFFQLWFFILTNPYCIKLILGKKDE
jgi:hypothetical protein